MDALIVAAILLTATLSFGLGVLAGQDMAKGEGSDISLTERPLEAAQMASVAASATSEEPIEPITEGGQYVASKNGEAYYLPWCGGATRIKAENKVWLASKEEAESKGYRPAKNCKGI